MENWVLYSRPANQRDNIRRKHTRFQHFETYFEFLHVCHVCVKERRLARQLFLLGHGEGAGAHGGGKHPAKRVGSGDTVHRGAGGSNSSNSGGSGDDGGLQSPSHTILSPLFPMLSTLELAQNNLHSVPVNIHLVSTLACLVLRQCDIIMEP